MHTPSSSDWEREIATLEDEANRAFVNRDVERLDELFSDELLVNSPINRVNDKQKLLELLGSGVIGHVFCELRHELMRRDGDLVIVMGSDTVQDTPADPILRRRVTNVWRRERNRWRLYVRHANLIADAASLSGNSRQPAT